MDVDHDGSVRSLQVGDVELVTKAMAEAGRTRRFKARSCGVTPRLLIPLCKGLEACRTLREVNLAQNSLRNPGKDALGALNGFIMRMPLTSLDLSHCSLGDEDIGSLATGLLKCPSLQELALEGNRFGNQGAVVLADVALVALPNLEVLNLGGNAMHGAGVIRVCKAVAAHAPNLRVFIVHSFDPAGEESDAALAIAHVLKTCEKLVHVDLSGTTFPDVQCILDGALAPLGLHTLNLGSIPDEAAAVKTVRQSRGLEIWGRSPARHAVPGPALNMANATSRHLRALRALLVAACVQEEDRRAAAAQSGGRAKLRGPLNEFVSRDGDGALCFCIAEFLRGQPSSASNAVRRWGNWGPARWGGA